MRIFVAAVTIVAVTVSSTAGARGGGSVFAPERPEAPALVLALEPAPSLGAAGLALDDLAAAEDDGAPDSRAIRYAASSLLLPGLGEYRLGHELRAKVFFGLEGLSWVAFGSFLWVGYNRENAYKDYAAAFAGVTDTSRPEDYWRAVGQYLSNDGPGGYNEAMRREARDRYYPNIDAIDAWYESHRIVGDQSWRWRSEESFDRYGDLRSGSSQAYRAALYSAVFAGALRIVSALDALRLARGESQGADAKTSLEFDGGPERIAFAVKRSF